MQTLLISLAQTGSLGSEVEKLPSSVPVMPMLNRSKKLTATARTKMDNDTSNEKASQTLSAKPMQVMDTTSQGPWKRAKTAYRSFRVLRDLTPEQVDNFMKSYIIYDLDWSDEDMMIATLGPDYQRKVGECLSDYYSVLNHVCAIGELEKMYIPPIMDRKVGITKNQELYEASIAKELNLPPRPRLLDLGCGQVSLLQPMSPLLISLTRGRRGRVAAHMTRVAGARVTGINIDADQVASARAYNEKMGFQNDFIRRDFNDLPLPLPDNEFDGFYNIQAFSLCKDIPKMCRELYRVLKPGARLSFLDWVKLDAYDETDPHHRELMRKIKPLIGAVGTPTPESMAADIESAGFKIVSHSNASIAADGLQAPLIERADWFFHYAKHVLYGMVRVGLLPAHFKPIIERFVRDGKAFIEADKARLVTTCYHWLAEKPRDVPAHTGLISSTGDSQGVVEDSSSAKSSDASSVDDIKSRSPAISDWTPSLTADENTKKDPLTANDVTS